jgi:hypothetical protein
MKRESVLLQDWLYIHIEISKETISSYLTYESSIRRRCAEHELRGMVKAGRGMVFPASFNDLNN